jgi:hypothetical protein
MRFHELAPFLIAAAAFGQAPPAWVARSNQNAQILIDLSAKYNPESASANGQIGFDNQVMVITPDRQSLIRADAVKAGEELKRRLAAEKDPLVQQDLQILIDANDRDIHQLDVRESTFLRYLPVARIVFRGMQTLLDDQVAPERRPSALVRLKKYTGMEPGFTPIVERAEQAFRAGLNRPELLGPTKAEVERDIADSATFLNGAGLLFEKYRVAGYQDALARLRQQLAGYDDFLRKEVLPRSRADFRLPPQIYQVDLDNYGVDYTPSELERLAHQTFTEIQEQMRPIAERIARQRRLSSTDYRDVIRALKKEQIPGDQILPVYQRRLAEIEDIVRKNRLVTLPQRPAIIKIASAAETAQQPAPHMQPPPLVNNHGERGAFVLPLETKGEGGSNLRYDDFTFDAAAWTLIAHEARPGHELQFDAMVEKGVSLARALFAFNSTNVEGWGLYSEWFMLPYLPDEGKLISLQLRMLRAARAFLDPELQEGKVTPERAMEVLEKDVVTSRAFATEEVERFTFRSPGQAVSYFDGYTRLLEIRRDAEQALGPNFNVQRFHDFILAQGLLPPKLLRKAVMEEFVAAERK